jgi:hypothetical protein
MRHTRNLADACYNGVKMGSAVTDDASGHGRVCDYPVVAFSVITQYFALPRFLCPSTESTLNLYSEN